MSGKHTYENGLYLLILPVQQLDKDTIELRTNMKADLLLSEDIDLHSTIGEVASKAVIRSVPLTNKKKKSPRRLECMN